MTAVFLRGSFCNEEGPGRRGAPRFQGLQPWQYVSLEVNAVERCIVALSRHCAALLRCSCRLATPRFRCYARIMTLCAHSGDFTGPAC
jgi:hypothetical protein